MKQALIFDMDGTLWDSADEVAISWNEGLRELGIEDITLTRERITSLMGCTMDAFARDIFADYPPERGMEMLAVLEQVENDYLREHGAALLGDVAGTFARLRARGWFIGIISNSQAGYIEAFLAHYHMEDLVDDWLSYGDTREGKAANLRRMIEKNALDRAWYVGDTAGDCAACREAGVPFIWAAYGFGDVTDDVPRVHALEDVPDMADSLAQEV